MARCDSIEEVFLQIYHRKINYLPIPLWINKAELLLSYIQSYKNDEKRETFVIVDYKQNILNEWVPVLASAGDIEYIIYANKETASQVEETHANIIFVPSKMLSDMRISVLKDKTTLVIGEMYHFSHDKTDRFKCLLELRSQFDRVLAMTRYYPFVDIQRLWAQFLILDAGARLGKDRKAFDDRFFYRTDNSGAVLSALEEKEDAMNVIIALTSDVVIDMPFNHEIIERDYTESTFCMEMGRWEASVYDAMSGVLSRMTREKGKTIKRTLSQIADGLAFSESGNAIVIHENKILLLNRIVKSYRNNRITIFCASAAEADYLKDMIESVQPIRRSPLYHGWQNESCSSELVFLNPDSTEDEVRKLDYMDIIVWFSQCPKIWQKKALLDKISKTPDYIRPHIGVSVYFVTLNTIDTLLTRQIREKPVKQEGDHYEKTGSEQSIQ